MHLEVAATRRGDELFLPFDPARAFGGEGVLHEALLADVVRDGERRDVALFAYVDEKRLAEHVATARAEHVEEGPIGERQVARRVTPNDGVFLRVEQGAIARFVFAQLPLHVLQTFQAEIDALPIARMLGAGCAMSAR